MLCLISSAPLETFLVVAALSQGLMWHFLCTLTILLCFFRLFIEKLPKHRDYKSAIIPEKKDAVKVGPVFTGVCH